MALYFVGDRPWQHKIWCKRAIASSLIGIAFPPDNRLKGAIGNALGAAGSFCDKPRPCGPMAFRAAPRAKCNLRIEEFAARETEGAKP
jgi:hypothetical protein